MADAPTAPPHETMNAREAAYAALMASLREEKYIVASLEEWQQREKPSPLDFSFAYEIAAGTTRMALALDYLAVSLSTRQKLSLKLKERVLLRTALYQRYYMDKVPTYAIANETITLAKKFCHQTFANYLNALMRHLPENAPELPQGNSAKDLSIRFSYPLYFVEALLKEYPADACRDILAAGNKTPQVMVRIRPGCPNLPSGLTAWAEAMNMAILSPGASLKDIAASPHCYIQNATPAVLIEKQAKSILPPKRILDLCASPGGKLIAVHDAFPKAQLFGNDVSPEKLERLSANLNKFGIEATLSCGLGEDFVLQEPFDLVILDVPCSNSGVLNKRPEARWRLSAEALEKQKKTQWALLEKALNLITPSGRIWYLTCSILKAENESLIEAFCQKHDLKISSRHTVLPTTTGWDGGFACEIQKS